MGPVLDTVGRDARLVGLDPDRWAARLDGLVVTADPPGLETHTDVLVVPEHRALYDADGRLIPASVRPVTGRRQAPTFACPERIAVPRRTATLDGHLLYAGTLHQEFGHFLVEGVGRLWPLLDRRFDGVLCDRDDPRVAAAFRDLVLRPLLGARVGRGALRSVTAPTRVATVTVPHASWPYWGSAHAVHAAVTTRADPGGAGDARDVDPGDGERPTDGGATDRPLYLTRELLPPALRHAPEETALTRELRRRGVRVVAPERLAPAAQLRLVRRHRVVVGMVGSALHAVLMAGGLDRLTVYLCGTDEPVFPSFPVQDALTGTPAAYVGCTTSDPRSPKGGADRDVRLDPGAALAALEELGVLSG